MFAVIGLLPLWLPRSEEDPETELFTAANTTLAKDIPDVDPRKRGSLAPCTDTMPMFETSLVSFSRSLRSFSSFVRPVFAAATPSSWCGAPAADGGLEKEPLVGGKLGLKCSAAANVIELSCSSDSR